MAININLPGYSRMVTLGRDLVSTRFPGVRGTLCGNRIEFHGGGGPGLNLRRIRSDCTVVVTRKLGDIMFGCPPEIVKNFMRSGRPIPQTVVLGDSFIKDGSVLYELEFPFYANKYINKSRFRIIGTPEMLERAKVILSESFFGPPDHTEGKAERDYFRDTAKLEDCIDFIPLKGKSIEVDGVKIVSISRGVYSVIEDGVNLGIVNINELHPSNEVIGAASGLAFEPPRFGVTVIGTSTGFDPSNRTTSLILWINGKGIFIDPLPNPLSELKKYGIEPGQVPYVLLTHCHSDHDTGLISQVLSGQKVRLITSRAIYESFLRKAEALVGFHIKDYIELIEADPGQRLELEGGTLNIGAALHSIPTINLVAEYQAGETCRRIAYSADTLYNPAELAEMAAKGVISPARMQELLQFVQNGTADLLIQEAGVVRPHTLPETLASLPAAQKKKILLVHVPSKAVDPALGLKIPALGETAELVISRAAESRALESFAAHPWLGALPVKAARQVVARSRIINFKAGEKIGPGDGAGNKLLLVLKGKLMAVSKKILEKGAHYLIGKEPAEGLTGGQYLEIDKKELLSALADLPKMASRLQKLKQLILNPA